MITDDVEMQIEQQGVASYKVDDGEVFVFSAAILRRLLAKAESNPRRAVIVCVKTRGQA